MVNQGFFSTEKKRMAGEKENTPFFSTKVESVQVANKKSYYGEEDKQKYEGDDYEKTKKYLQKEDEKSYKDTLGNKYKEAQKVADELTGGKYNIKDSPYAGLINAPSSFFDSKTKESLKTDFTNEKGEISNPSLGIRKEMTTANYVADDPGIGFREGDHLSITPYKKNLMGGKVTGIGVQINPYKGFDLSNKTGLGIGDTGFKGYLQKKAFGDGGMYSSDPVTQAYKNSMLFNRKELSNAAIYNQLDREQNPQNFNEDGSRKTLEQKYGGFLNEKDKAANEYAIRAGYDSYSDLKKSQEEFSNRIDSKFNKDEKATMPSMGITEAGRKEAEKNRLEKAKEKTNPSVLQRVGNFLGDTFNAITGTQPLQSSTIDSSQYGMDPSRYTETEARVAQAINAASSFRDGSPNLGITSGGTKRSTPTGTSSQFSGSGEGLAKTFSSPGLGISRGFGRSSTGTNTSSTSKGISRSQSRGQGGGTASRSKGGSFGGSRKSNTGSKSASRGTAGSRGRGGTGTGSSRSGGTTGRSASSASKKNTGRGRSQCDIRTKIDIAPLTNTDLIRDDLANVAYFVKEIK